jgi:hypothetical protein
VVVFVAVFWLLLCYGFVVLVILVGVIKVVFVALVVAVVVNVIVIVVDIFSLIVAIMDVFFLNRLFSFLLLKTLTQFCPLRSTLQRLSSNSRSTLNSMATKVTHKQ